VTGQAPAGQRHCRRVGVLAQVVVVVCRRISQGHHFISRLAADLGEELLANPGILRHGRLGPDKRPCKHQDEQIA
jgi:hypothetical protein